MRLHRILAQVGQAVDCDVQRCGRGVAVGVFDGVSDLRHRPDKVRCGVKAKRRRLRRCQRRTTRCDRLPGARGVDVAERALRCGRHGINHHSREPVPNVVIVEYRKIQRRVFRSCQNICDRIRHGIDGQSRVAGRGIAIIVCDCIHDRINGPGVAGGRSKDQTGRFRFTQIGWRIVRIDRDRIPGACLSVSQRALRGRRNAVEAEREWRLTPVIVRRDINRCRRVLGHGDDIRLRLWRTVDGDVHRRAATVPIDVRNGVVEWRDGREKVGGRHESQCCGLSRGQDGSCSDVDLVANRISILKNTFRSGRDRVDRDARQTVSNVIIPEDIERKIRVFCPDKAIVSRIGRCIDQHAQFSGCNDIAAGDDAIRDRTGRSREARCGSETDLWCARDIDHFVCAFARHDEWAGHRIARSIKHRQCGA